MTNKSKQALNMIIIPLNGRILFRRDEPKRETKGGIVLPDDSKIDMITGRVLGIAPDLEKEGDCPISEYDKVLIHPQHAVPVDLEDVLLRESGGQLYVVPFSDVVAVFKRKDDDDD